MKTFVRGHAARPCIASLAFLLLSLVLIGCDLFTNGSGDPDASLPDTTAEDTLLPTDLGADQAAAGETLPAGAVMAFKETTVTWDTEDPLYTGKYVVIDVPNRKIVFQDNPNEVAKYGEMEVTWDAPPETITEGFQFPLNYGVAITKTPTWMAGIGIRVSYSPVWYFTEPNGNPGEVWAGMNGNVELVPGSTKQITLGAANLASRIGEEGCLHFIVGNVTVSYCYVIVQE